MRYGMIALVGGRSRTRSPSGRRQNMGADATHRALPCPPRSTVGYGGPVAFADLLGHPEVRETLVLGSRVGFLALHGGLEPGTSEIAAAAAHRAGASWYAVVQPDHLRRHVPSTQIDPSSSTAL